MSDPLEAQFATLSIHADDRLNIVPDVAPPIHLATTFRYNDNPDELIPEAEQTVRYSVLLFILMDESILRLAGTS